MCLPGFPQWVTLLHHQYQLTSHPSTGSLATFKNQAKYLLIDGQYKSCQDADKVGALLNWLGPKSYGVYDELEFGAGKSKTNVQHVLDASEAYFKPTVSLPELVSTWWTILQFFQVSNRLYAETERNC